MMSWPRYMLLGLAAGLFSGCSQDAREIRHYREIVVQAPAAPAHSPDDGHNHAEPAAPQGRLAWTAPEGWTELPGSEMRLATFKIGTENAECTIVAFPGEAGGVKANIRRWLGQISVEVGDEQLDAFLRSQPSITTEGGLPCTIFDFAPLLPVGADNPTSMIAGIAAANRQSIFIKLMGPASVLAAEQERFTALCTSLRLEQAD
jgi:hypothetical protein